MTGKRSEVLRHERRWSFNDGRIFFSRRRWREVRREGSWPIRPDTRLADDGKRSEDSQSSGVERFVVPAAAKAFFCFFSLGGRSVSIHRVADLWFMKQNNIKMELPRGQN